MAKCRGLHCPGCGDGGGGVTALVLIVLLVIGAVIARPAAHAAGSVLRVTVEVLEITGIILASAAGAATLAGVAVLATRARRSIASREPAPYRVISVRSAVAPLPQRAEIAAPAATRALEAPPAQVPWHVRQAAEPQPVTRQAPRPRCPHRGASRRTR
jgi:hypothetical protein